ncbi:GNAT family N-acetyltransferase [Caproiciproducens sp. R1]|jgi:Acetyltransferase (GNAT) family.|uniref:GNAT family N-acetyltransferase n=1 Tax=Caproiciproducens sp. R1 TaxID=3435000 RepID=UPI0040339A63
MTFAPESAIVLGDKNDLPMIYEDMKQQFPPSELYPYPRYLQLLNGDRYKILLFRRLSDNELIGYALVYAMEDSNILWLDYLAVLKKHHACGYGSALFRALWQKYCGPFDGILFSVEYVSETDPELAEQQKRRIRFYEKLGAHRLHAKFLQPCEDGGFPMYLYFKPRCGYITISRSVQMQAVSQMYEYCFFYLKHIRELLPKFRDTIVDEKFTD